MPIKIAKRVVINPTDITHSAFIHSLFLDHVEEIKAYQLYELPNPNTGELTEYTFTHSLYLVKKTGRENKEDGNYYAVCTPRELGKGCFGQVHTVEGMWKNETQQSVYKTKATIDKQRALKIGLLNRSTKLNNDRVLQFDTEYEIGRFTPHMGFKYPPTLLKKSINVLMRKQQGETLESLIHKINKQTELLTVTERLQTTIHLLEKLHTQVSGIALPEDYVLPNAYIVHQDIKPSNIMRTLKGDINYIDFGLAIPNTFDVRKLTVSGTDLWMDPFRYNTCNRRKTNTSAMNPTKVSDLGSLARVIAEFWGDTSRHEQMSEPELLRANEENITVGLCEHISELGSDEKKSIFDLIKSMTNYHEKDRLSREDALAKFQGLLDGRLNLLKNSINDPLDLITTDLLFEILKSPVAEALFARIRKQPHELPGVWKKIQPQLQRLDEQSIRTLHSLGLDLSKHVITIKDINAKAYLPEQIPLLIELGAQLEPKLLEEWYYYTRDDNKLYWAKMCRAIYQATPNPESVMSPKPLNKTFESQFYTRFLTKKETAKDEDTNVRLLQRHLQATAIEDKEIESIRQSLKPIHPTALSKAILDSKLIKPSEELLLHQRTYFTSLHYEILIFMDLVTQAQGLKPIASLPQRDEAIAKIQAEIEERKKLQGYNDWQTALEASTLSKKIKAIKIIDSCYVRLGQIGDVNATTRFQAELSKAYQQLDESSTMQLQKETELLYLAYTDHLKNIDATRAAISAINPELLTQLDAELKSLLDSSSLKNSNDVYNHIACLNARYDDLYELNVAKRNAPILSLIYSFFPGPYVPDQPPSGSHPNQFGH